MLKYDTKSGHTSLLRDRSGGGALLTQTLPKPTVNIPTVNIPTLNMPTVKTQKNNMRETQKTDKKNTPLARHSRKRGGEYWFQDTQSHSNYSARIALFPDLCWEVKGFGTLVVAQCGLKWWKKQNRNLYLRNGGKTMARRGNMLLFRLTCYQTWGFGGLGFSF